MASSIADLEKEIMDKMRQAISETHASSKSIIDEEVGSFYSQGSPQIYVRTGALGDSPEVTGVSTGGKEVSFTAKLNPPNYAVPNPAFTERGLPSYFNGYQVLEAAENHTHGVLGKPGFWKRSTQRIEKELNSNMGKYFHK